MNDMIKALMENEKPFGLMTAEMQEKAKEIGFRKFKFLLGNHSGGWSNDADFDDMFRWYRTYRLRPDYSEKPEIVECEVHNSGGILHCSIPGEGDRTLEKVLMHANFAGTRFKDVFGDEIYHQLWLNLDKEQNGNHKMTHCSHVLFSKKD